MHFLRSILVAEGRIDSSVAQKGKSRQPSEKTPSASKQQGWLSLEWGPQGEGNTPHVPAQDHNLPLVNNLPVKSPQSSKYPFNKYLRTYDYVLGIIPGAWNTAANKTKVPALMAPTFSRGERQ